MALILSSLYVPYKIMAFSKYSNQSTWTFCCLLIWSNVLHKALCFLCLIRTYSHSEAIHMTGLNKSPIILFASFRLFKVCQQKRYFFQNYLVNSFIILLIFNFLARTIIVIHVYCAWPFLTSLNKSAYFCSKLVISVTEHLVEVVDKLSTTAVVFFRSERILKCKCLYGA